MPGYPLFIPEFVLCTNSSLFWFKIANELSEFRNYLYIINGVNYFVYNFPATKILQINAYEIISNMASNP